MFQHLRVSKQVHLLSILYTTTTCILRVAAKWRGVISAISPPAILFMYWKRRAESFPLDPAFRRLENTFSRSLEQFSVYVAVIVLEQVGIGTYLAGAQCRLHRPPIRNVHWIQIPVLILFLPPSSLIRLIVISRRPMIPGRPPIKPDNRLKSLKSQFSPG